MTSYPIIPKLNAIPDDIISVSDYERVAKEYLPFPVYEYISSGCADELTLRNNRNALDSIQLYNRVLADVTHASTAIQLLGQSFRHPILLAPVAHQGLVHEAGELATAEAADATDTGMVVSTLASRPIADIAQQTHQPKWFQLYFQSNRRRTLDLVKQVERAGYTSLLVTVDTPIHGPRNRIQRAGFQLPPTAQALIANQTPTKQIELSHAQSIIFQGVMTEAPNWQDIAWLRKRTTLPILLKGILHPDDALRAIQTGCQGVVVSNHGGRALDSVPASITALPAIRQRLGQRAVILMDGGIRRGTDVFKALALGADAVLVGRPQVYALAVAGALGVAHMLKLLRDEFEITMALTGCATLSAIDDSLIFRNSF